MRLILCAMAICSAILGNTDTMGYCIGAALVCQGTRYVINWYNAGKIMERLANRRPR